MLAVCGDGGFMMNSQELETAVRLKLNLVVLVLAGQRLRHDPLEAGGGRVSDYGMTFGDPDFDGLRRGLWREGQPSGERRRIPPCAGSRLRRGGVHLVSTPIDYSENKRVLVNELRAHGAGIDID